MTGAPGSGKSTLARRLVLEADGALVAAAREWADPEVARRALLDAAAISRGTLAVDDAQHLIGTAAESVLEEFVAASDLDRLIVVSRRPPTFAIDRDSVVPASALALRLPDVAAVFRSVCGRRIDPEIGSRVRHETAGWARLVRELAVSAEAETDEELDAWLGDAVEGDIAAGWLEEVLADLPQSLVDALTATSPLPQLDLARTSSVLGHEGAAELLAALDAGVVMHTRRDGGRRALPPMLRRHLLHGMDPPARTRAVRAAVDVLLDEGAGPEAADALAAGRAWNELEDLLQADPDARHAAMLWVERPPARLARRSAGIAAALAQAASDDRLVPTGATEATGVEANDTGGVGAPGRGAPTSAQRRLPGSTPRRPLLADAAERIGRGDLAGSVPLLRRAARTAEAGADRCRARLVLLVVRAPTAGSAETLDGLLALERQCVEYGLGGLARLARGAIAALTTVPERGTVSQVVDQFEARGDSVGACAVSAIDVLDRFRRGIFEIDRTIEFADRCERFGFTDAATWCRGMAAVGAAITGSPRAPDLIAALDAATITLRMPGPRALLEAAVALRTADPAAAAGRAATARRAAIETGLPRLPFALPRRPRPRVETAERAGVRVAVACFGGFRLQLDGVDADLRLVRPQARMLLRMLALNAGAPLHREHIADLLWTDLGSESALHALHVSVSSLRRMLPASGRQGGIVERVGEAYRLGIAANRDCDLADFDEHLSEAAIAKARREPGIARDRLVSAIDLYRGDVLPEDGPAEWAVGARERYRHRAGEAASSLAHLHSHFGDQHAAVAMARRAVEIDPWLDDSWRTLVAMHDRAGDVIAARRAEEGYRSMREALGAE
ncbi:BTAD domain-containing putative transcriptional regulator [Agromyces sp. CF514]|uniref:AfsR/SARP family transcriptional regulator n=1 Tax=Agromyces sp. CF514 TaxID=1881031 RepID=UPI0015A5B95E|nr:BTAD domain-containing putative transcriptional regulator [Agromyces sp. CF514]